jgi:pantothenate kinase type III
MCRSPPLDLGRDTATAMQAGLYWLNVYGLAGLLRGLLTELHLADSTPILATGGLAASLFPDLQRQLPQLQLVGDLTLRGLWQAQPTASSSQTQQTRLT